MLVSLYDDHMKRYHVSVAAEACAAATFARASYEVSVQYGANQPGYDLMVVKGARVLKISVKGSQDGGWVVNGPFKKKNVTYGQALAAWLAAQPTDVVMPVSIASISGTIARSLPTILPIPRAAAPSLGTIGSSTITVYQPLVSFASIGGSAFRSAIRPSSGARL